MPTLVPREIGIKDRSNEANEWPTAVAHPDDAVIDLDKAPRRKTVERSQFWGKFHTYDFPKAQLLRCNQHSSFPAAHIYER